MYICISRSEGLFTVELSGSFSGPSHFRASLDPSVWGVSLNLCARRDGRHLVPLPSRHCKQEDKAVLPCP